MSKLKDWLAGAIAYGLCGLFIAVVCIVPVTIIVACAKLILMMLGG